MLIVNPPGLDNGGIGTFVQISGDTMTGPLILSGNPTQSLQAVTKSYVDALLALNLSWKDKAESTTEDNGNINLSNPGTAIFSGHSASSGERILVNAQTDPKENGIYDFNGASSAMTRSADSDTGAELQGATVNVAQGNYAGEIYYQQTDSPTIGVSNIVWSDILSGILVGDGITINVSGNVISLANDGITDIHVNTAAAIQGTKIDPNFGNQFVVSTGPAQFENVTVNGNSGSGFLHLAGQNTTPSNPGVGQFRIYDTTAGILGLFSGSGAGGAALFDVTAMTTNKTFTFPDLSGIVALVPTAGFVTSNGSKLTSQAAIDLSTDVTGVLDIPNGGTNSSSYTQGSVIFASATKLTENNNEFFWDDTNFRLGIQASGAPTTALQVGSADASKYLQLDTNAGLIVSGAGSNVTRIVAESTFGSGVPAEIAIAARPSSAMGGFEALGWLSFFGRDNAGNQRRGAYIRGITSGAWTSTSLPTHMDFFTVPSGSDTEVQRMRLYSSGELYTGSTGLVTQTGTLSVGPLSTSKVGIYVRGNSGQTADLLQLQNNSAVTIMNVEADGDLNARSLKATGTIGAGFLELADQSVPVTAPTSAIRVFSSGGNLAVKTSSPVYTFDHSLLSTSRTFQFIDDDYIIANVPAVIGVVKSSGSDLTSGLVDLATEITGTLSIANGGTGAASLSSGFIKSNGSVLSSVSAIDLAADVGGTVLPVANGGTGQTTFSAGVIVSNGSAISSNHREVVTNAAITTNSTVVYANVADLASGTLQPGKYKISANIVYRSVATTTGIGVRIVNNTATLTRVQMQWRAPLTASTAATLFQIATGTNLASTSTPAANTDYSVIGDGFIDVSVAGSVIIQLRSEIGGSAVSIRPGSFVLIEAV